MKHDSMKDDLTKFYSSCHIPFQSVCFFTAIKFHELHKYVVLDVLETNKSIKIVFTDKNLISKDISFYTIGALTKYGC